MNLICAGSRDLSFSEHAAFVRDALRYWTAVHWRPTAILCGCATGADALGAYFGKKAGVEVREFPADWTRGGAVKFDPRQGPIRNGQMVKEADGLAVIRFTWSDGSADVLKQATAKGIPVLDMLLDESRRAKCRAFEMREAMA